MPLKFFNTLTRKKELFKPIRKGCVRMYSCGPTVYAPPHIGNYRAFLVADLIKRYLLYKGFKVKHVMNITDIDDKTIRNSAKEGLSLKQFTRKYEKIFFHGIDVLNIKRADVYPRATEHIKDMIALTRKLVKAGYAYEKMGSVYFDISKFKDYGKLSKINLKKIKIGARVSADEYAKDAPQDFALMKRSTTEELKRGIYYKTEWGNVRPGWHLECSVMSMRYLGTPFDIHTGGVDLIFPHHENEIAQSEAATGKKFVNYWLHNEHLMVEGEKMSKSLGNYYTLEDLLNMGYDPLAIRYLLLATHYKKKLNFTFKGLEAAKRTVDSMHDFIVRLKESKGKKNPKVKELVAATKKKFEAAMDDNLNISLALAALHRFIGKINKLIDDGKVSKSDAKLVMDLMFDIDKVLGLELKAAVKKRRLPAEAKRLIEQRERARKEGDYKTADAIRQRLKKEFGIVIEDTLSGPKWKMAERKK